MSVALASSLYDLTKGSIFSYRNIDKTKKGDIVRAGVAAGQLRNAARVLGECEKESKHFKIKNLLFHKVKTYSNAFDALAKEKSVWGYCAKGVNFASNWINPLICVSGAYKVVKAKDKDSEAIKQTCALGSMFTFEKTAKSLLTKEGRDKLTTKAISKNTFVKKIMDCSASLDKQARNSHNKFVKYGIPIAKALGFIGMSITGYAVGATVGEKINEMRKSQPPKLIAQVEPQKMDINA